MNISTFNKNVELADIQEEINLVPEEYLTNLYELIHIFRKNIIPDTAQVHSLRIENYINVFTTAFKSVLVDSYDVFVNYYIQSDNAVWLELDFFQKSKNLNQSDIAELEHLDTLSILEGNDFTEEYFLGKLQEKQKQVLFLPKAEKIYLVKLPQNYYWASIQAKNDAREMIGVFLEQLMSREKNNV